MSYYGNLHKRITNPSEGSTSAYVSVAAAADVFRYSPNAPVQVMRWGFIAATTVNDATNALKLSGDVRATAGSNVGRTTGATTTISSQTGYNASNQPAFYSDAAGGSITLTAGAAQLAAGAGVYHNVNPQTGSGTPTLYPRPQTDNTPPGGVDTQLVIYPGQEFVIAVQPNAPASGTGIVFIEVKELPFADEGNNNANAASGIPSAIRPTPSSAGKMTRVLS